MKFDLRKIYRFEAIPFTKGEALPVGGDIYYECEACTEVVSSVPNIPAKCECGNLSGNKGEITVRETEKVKPVRGKLK